MSNTLELTLTTTGSVTTPITINDLDAMTFQHPATISLSDMFDITQLADSEGLQAELDAGSITITTQEAVNVAEVKRLIDIASIDLDNFQNTVVYAVGVNQKNASQQYFSYVDGIKLDKAPIYAPFDFFIVDIVATNNSVGADYDVLIERSPNFNSGPWTTLATVACTGQTTIQTFGSTLLVLQGEGVRISLIPNNTSSRPNFPIVRITAVEDI